MKQISVYLLIVLFATVGIKIHAQCCSAGNPLSTESDLVNSGVKNLKIGVNYRHSFSNTFYSENQALEIGIIDKANYNFTDINLSYGIFHRATLKAELGYFINKTEKYNIENMNNAIGSGLGDASLQFRYLLYKSFTNKWELSGGLGIKLPVGVFDQEVNNVKLPITVQPSSGSFKYFANAFFHKSKGNLALYSLASIEVSQTIDSDNFYWKYGNVYALNTGAIYNWKNKLSAGIQLRGELRERSSRENKQTVEASGGFIMYCAPLLSAKIAKGYYAMCSINIPVYKYVNVLQLTNAYSFSIGFQRKFNFDK